MRREETALLTTRRLLKIGVLTPALLVADVALAQWLTPQLDPGSQFISQLGGAKAAVPILFNIGMWIGGSAGILAGAGFSQALEAAGGRRVVSAFAGLWVALTGLGAIFAGTFHMPDHMHQVCGVGLAIQIAPLFTAWALWGKPGWRTLAWASLIWFFAYLVVLALLIGVWNVRTGADVGYWQRAHAFLGLVWLGLAAWTLQRGALPDAASEMIAEPSAA